MPYSQSQHNITVLCFLSPFGVIHEDDSPKARVEDHYFDEIFAQDGISPVIIIQCCKIYITFQIPSAFPIFSTLLIFNHKAHNYSVLFKFFCLISTTVVPPEIS